VIAAFEWGGLSLLDPWFLLVAPLATAAVVFRALRPRAALPTAAVALFDGVPRTWRQRFAALPVAGKLLAALALAVALARPVQREVLPLRDQGIDIVLAVDTSSSMLIPDMRDDERYRRMDAARERALAFAKARRSDRVALVTFARYAELRCPPTLDETALTAFLATVDTVPRESELDGTAIGTALAKSVQVLQKSEAKSRVVVLLTDGETTVDDITPTEGIKLAKDAGVRVHTIGLGKGMPTPFGRMQPLEFTDLKAIARDTGGEFFQPRSDDELAAVYTRIDELEKTTIEDPRYRAVDRFEWPLGIGLVLLLVSVLAEVLLFRRVP
jgi:Ca-activated chloride channel family protein